MAGLRPGGRSSFEGHVEFESFEYGVIVMVPADGRGAHIRTSCHSRRSSTIM